MIPRDHAQSIVDRIDAVSRQRSLDDRESKALEYFIAVADGKDVPPRIPFGTNKVLAAMGIKRDMTIYPSKQNKRIEGVRRHTEKVSSREELREALRRRGRLA